MATTGKIPMLGFKAAAIKFVSLFGFSPNDSVTPPDYRPIAMTGSLEVVALTGYVNYASTGSVPQQALTGVYED